VVTAVVGVAIFMLIIALVIAVARDPGPPPDDVAVAYERAWDGLDFDALWSLSGDELRDGMGHKPFIAAKQAAYVGQVDLGGLADSVAVEDLEIGDHVAVVHTLVTLRHGGTARNELGLEQRAGRWVVVSYRLLGSDASPASP
jgi:hypothetical protein